MTVLSVLQDACLYLGIEQPSAVFGEAGRTETELSEFAIDAAYDIMKAHDWQLLATQATITGDGSTENFALESDYDRMDHSTNLWSSSFEAPLYHVKDRDQWLGLDIRQFDFIINAWTLYGNQIYIKPALANAATVKYWYISNKVVTAADASTKATLSVDTDVFRISERLLKKGVIWNWKKSKGLAYQEELKDYEILLQKMITADKGSKTVRIGKTRNSGTKTAYPQTIVG